MQSIFVSNMLYRFEFRFPESKFSFIPLTFALSGIIIEHTFDIYGFTKGEIPMIAMHERLHAYIIRHTISQKSLAVDTKMT